MTTAKTETWRDYWPSLREIKAHDDRTGEMGRGQWLLRVEGRLYAGSFRLPGLFCSGPAKGCTPILEWSRSALTTPHSFSPLSVDGALESLFVTDASEREAEHALLNFYRAQVRSYAPEADLPDAELTSEEHDTFVQSVYGNPGR